MEIVLEHCMCIVLKSLKEMCTLLANMYTLPHKSNQAVKKWCGLKILGEKSCEIKGGSQEMAAMMLMLINFNNAHSHY